MGGVLQGENAMRPFSLLGALAGLLLSPPFGAAHDRYCDPLPAGAIARLGTVRFRTGKPLGALAVSPDGKVLATDRKLWDAATGKRVLSWKSANSIVRINFDSQGQQLLCHVGGHQVEVMDRATGKLVRVIKSDQPVEHAAVSGDGRAFVWGNSPKADKLPVDGVVGLIDIATGREMLRLQGTEFHATALAISHDGSRFACAGSDQVVRLFGAEKGTPVRALKGRAAQVMDLRFDPTGRLLLVQEADRSLSLWDAATGEEIRRVPFGCETFAFSPDGQRLAAAGYRATVEAAMVHVWDTATGKPLFPAMRSPDGVADLVFLPDGKTLAGATEGGWIRFWDLATGKEKTQPGHQAAIHSLSFGKDGLTLATGGGDGTVRLWDPRTGEELRSWDAPRQTAIVAFSPGGKLLAGASHGLPFDRSKVPDTPAPIVLWDPVTGKEVLRLPGHPAGVHSLAFAPDGQTLATGGGDKLVRLWDLAGPRPLHQLKGHGGVPGGLAFAPSGRMLASSSADGTVRLWETVSGSPRGQFAFATRNSGSGPGTIFFDVDGDVLISNMTQQRFGPLFFSDDGKTLLVGGDDQSLDLVFSPRAVDLHGSSSGDRQRQLRRYFNLNETPTPARYSLRYCDLASGKVMRRVPERPLPPAMECLTRSADGKSIAWVNGRTITVWDLGRNEAIGAWPVPQTVTALAFAPDQRLFASAGSDGTVLTWDLAAVLAKKPVAPLSAEARARQLEASWAQLADPDAGKAYQAMGQMAGSPADTVAFLAPRLQAVPPIEPAQLARWVADLDDADFEVRARATAELARRDDAMPLMVQALRGPLPLESRRRLEQLLEQFDKQPAAAFLRAYRAVELLEQIGTPEAALVLDRLAQGAPQARLTLAAAAARQRLQPGRK
jgi:WD40 repeat protein